MRKLFFLALIILESCSKNKPEDIFLFNDIYFETKIGETVPIIDANISQEYTKYLHIQNNGIPLFKYIHQENYGIFIGLPYGMSPDSLMHIKPLLPLLKTELEKFDSSTYSYRKFSTPQGLKLHTLACEINRSKIWIIGRTYNQNLPDSILSESALKNRIKFNFKKDAKNP